MSEEIMAEAAKTTPLELSEQTETLLRTVCGDCDENAVRYLAIYAVILRTVHDMPTGVFVDTQHSWFKDAGVTDGELLCVLQNMAKSGAPFVAKVHQKGFWLVWHQETIDARARLQMGEEE